MGSNPRRSLALLGFVTLACTRGESSRDPESLGYGPAGRELGKGYVEIGAPFERPPPEPWPVVQQPSALLASPPASPPTRAPRVEAAGDIQLLCVHVAGVLSQTTSQTTSQTEPAGEAIDRELLVEACLVHGRTEKMARTSEVWQAYFGCMLTAKSMAEFDACELRHPTYFEAASASDHAREREVCQHIVTTTMVEEMGDGANLPAAELEPFRPIVDECVTRLRGEERTKRTPEAYEALLDCVLEQSRSDAMEACE